MSKLSPDKVETIEIDMGAAFTPDEIHKGLTTWARNLASAKANGDIFAAETALRWIDAWLDRKNGH